SHTHLPPLPTRRSSDLKSIHAPPACLTVVWPRPMTPRRRPIKLQKSLNLKTPASPPKPSFRCSCTNPSPGQPRTSAQVARPCLRSEEHTSELQSPDHLV